MNNKNKAPLRLTAFFGLAAAMSFASNGYANAINSVGDTNPLTFGTGTTSASVAPRMTIVSTGLVGIGLTNPTTQLEVSGTISATQILVNGVAVGAGGSASTFASLTDIFYDTSKTTIASPGALGATGDGNTVFGVNTMTSSSGTGTNNTAFGSNSLRNVLTGTANTSVGVGVLGLNITGSYNVAMGNYALNATTAGYNTAIGMNSSQYNTTGIYTTALGMGALNKNTTANYNTALGASSLYFNKIGANNTVLGYQAAYGVNNTSVISNSVILGFQAGVGLTTAQSNTLIGYQAGYFITTGSNNVVIGTQAAPFSTTGNNQLSIANAIWGNIGSGTGNANRIGINVTSPTTQLEVSGTISATQILVNGQPIGAGGSSSDRIVSGTTGMYTYNNASATIATNGTERLVVGTNGNVGIGIQPVSGYIFGVSGSLYARGRFDLANNGQAVHIGTNAGSSANTDGVVIGYGAGSNSNVNQVSLIGWLAGEYNEGTSVTGLGRQAAQYNKGDGVLAIGDGAAQGNEGDAVFAIGDEAAHSNKANTVIAFGSGAARNNSGSAVVALGNFAAQNNGGADVTAVGHSAVNTNMFNNVTGLGYNAQPTASNQVMLGDTNVTAVSTSGIYYGQGLYVSGLVSATSITINGQPIGASAAGTYASLTDIKYDKANYNLSGPAGITSASTGLQYSTAFGINALSNPTYGGVNSTAFGASALASNTGDENTAVGSFALSSNTTALANTAVGSVALQYNTTGSSNSGFGAATLAANETGSGNTAIGTSALQVLSTGGYNTAMGSNALKNPAKLNHVVAIGYRAGYGTFSTSSTNSVFIGSFAGNAITTGNSNTLIGYNTGAGITTGHNNLIIGTNLSPFSNTGSNQLNIANSIFGDYGTPLATKVGINVTSPTTQLEVSGTISATQILVNGVAVATGGGTTDRIVSGSTSLIASPGALSALTSTFRISETTTSSTLLDINSNTSGTSRIRFGHATGYQLGIGREGNNGFIDYPNRFAIRQGTVNASSGASNTTVISFESSGNVGIGGITTAQTVLHVSGTLRIANGGEACDTNRLGAIRYSSGAFSICQNTTNGWESLATSGGSSSDRIISGTTQVIANTNTSISLVTANTERMVIGTNGNVGIGQQPGTAALSVSSSLQVGEVVLGRENATANRMEIGLGAATNKAAYIDFIGDTTYSDYGMRIWRTGGGANANSEITTRGTGGLGFTTEEAAPITFGTTNSERVRILANGNVGIGTTNPGVYKLYVAGDAYTTGTWGASDARFKENIHSMNGLLAGVTKLRPVTFTWNAKAPVKNDTNEQIGLIAQEVEAVYPDLVRTNPDGYKAVAYDKLSVLLLGAVKELKSENDTLKAQNEAILKRLEALEAKSN